MAQVEIPEAQAGFQNRFWQMQRVGWAVLALMVGVALAGLAGGGGPWSQAEVRRDAATLAVARVMRAGAAETLTVTVAVARQTDIVLHFDAGFLADFALGPIVPAPDGMRADGDGGLTARVAAAPGTAVLRIEVTPRAAGIGRHAIGVGGTALPFASRVLP